MSNDISATDLSVASDLPVESDSVSKRVPVEVVFADEDSDTSAASPVVETVVSVKTEVDSSPQSIEEEEITEVSNSEPIEKTETVSDEVVSRDVVSKEVISEEVVSEKANSKEVASEKVDSEKASSEQAIKTDDVTPIEAEINPFEEMGLSPAVLKAIAKAGYQEPSPIQAQTVPHILRGRDMMGQAETGSGKTAAFAWPALSNLDLSQKKPQIMILAPTRELAIQVTKAFEKYASELPGFRAVTIYGGASYDTQIRALRRGVHLVVGTPGRVMDHLRRETLDLSDVKTFILDEADEMLRMGFIDDVQWILEQVPEKRQILTFSATLPPPIQKIAQKHLNDPVHVVIKGNSATANSIEQTCVFLHPREKQTWLNRFLETEETEGVIIFVKTRQTTMAVSERLIQNGIIASALNGDIAQNQRERTVNQLKSGRINVVVATDVAARGLDVERISHVINYDFPHDTEAYVHRIGRTGRAGRKGRAILFVEPKEKGKLSRLQRATNQRIDTFKVRGIDEINADRIAKFKQQIVDATSNSQVKFFATLLNELQTDSGLATEDIASALAVMAQGDTPLVLKELSKAKSNWKKDRERKGDRNGGGRDRGPMKTFRVEVGRNHGVGPGNIVGAITNEADLNNSMIGKINIFGDFSTIDLPADIPNDLIEHLRDVQVSGQRLSITEDRKKYARPEGRGGRGRSNARGPRSYDKKSYGGKKKSWDKGSRGGASNGSGGGKPYKKKFSGKGDGEAKDFGERKSDSTSDGKKQYGYSKMDNAEFKSDRPSKSRSYDKNKKPSRPKTKAAQRTQAKRKPGAKLSSPVKKYVKIRSAK